MPALGQFALGAPRLVFDGAVALCAAYVSLALSSWAVAALATARFWEPWVNSQGVAVAFLLFAVVQMASGFVPGVIVGLLFARSSLRISRISLLAALFVLVLWGLAATLGERAGRIASGLFGAGAVATGLLVGALCTRKFRHA
jgi:hypothetical protein